MFGDPRVNRTAPESLRGPSSPRDTTSHKNNQLLSTYYVLAAISGPYNGLGSPRTSAPRSPICVRSPRPRPARPEASPGGPRGAEAAPPQQSGCTVTARGGLPSGTRRPLAGHAVTRTWNPGLGPSH